MSRLIGEQTQRVKQVIDSLNIRESNDSPEDIVTRSFGFIKFDGNEPDKTSRPSQYIRLALNTNKETVVRFMQEAWRLPTPDLIISITGGAKHCDLSPRLERAFQLGLVSAAATTNAWIITAGTNAGVVNKVGEAINKYRYKNKKGGLAIPCIGIGSWGYTAGNTQLDRSVPLGSNGDASPKKLGDQFAIEALQMTGESAFSVRTYIKQTEEKRCDLEPNHTHFLLFDDGTPKSENVLELRAEIEMSLRRTNIRKPVEGTAEKLIPIVMVLLEGGRSSIKCVCEALESNTPVVVVKESGRAADLVADLYAIFCKEVQTEDTTPKDENTDGEPSSHPSSFAETSLRITDIENVFTQARKNNPWVDEVRENLCRALHERKKLVTIFNFDTDEHHGRLEAAILESVFNAAKFSQESNDEHRSAAELRLALAWHSIDYARRAIFTDATISKWTEEDRRLGLVDALRRGFIDFVELFLNYGISFNKLTIGDLEYLYSTASIDSVLPLKKVKYDIPTRQEFYTDYMKNQSEVNTDKNVVLGEHAIRELFFWAIFVDKYEFAVYLGSKTWNQSIALLFGARLYRKADKMTLDSEASEKYKIKAENLDKYAASIIDRCFDTDKDFAVNILKRPAQAFYNVDPLRLALRANCRAFLASRCVQRHLDNEWFGNINYKRQNINIRVFFCSLFFPLLPIFFWTLPYLHRHLSFNPNANYHPKNSPELPIDTDINSTNVRWTQKIFYFFRAPIVRFYYNLIFFFIFLGLFSFVLLFDYFPLNTLHGQRSGINNLPIPITEICLHICLWSIIIEEIRQVFLMKSYGDYFEELSNLTDITAILLYLIGFGTRFIVKEEFFIISKITLGIDLILWYIRILHLFAAYERLGPKLIMIFKTMKDLLFFVCFILIFLFGFSITSWALLISSSQVTWNYNTTGGLESITINDNSTHVWSWQLLRDMTNYGVWKVFGQVDVVETNNSYSAVAFILAILFVAISNVLLLNVLVALFNVTIENVQEKSHDLWRYQRFLIVNEFRNKSLLPPPFNTLYCFCSAVLRFIRRHQKRYRGHHLVAVDNLSINIIGHPDDSFNEQFKITEAMQREIAIAEDFWPEALEALEEKSNRGHGSDHSGCKCKGCSCSHDGEKVSEEEYKNRKKFTK